jgi:hypothetical protein
VLTKQKWLYKQIHSSSSSSSSSGPHPQSCQLLDAVQQWSAVAGQAQREAAQLREPAGHHHAAISQAAVRLECQLAQVAQLRALAQARICAFQQAGRRAVGQSA